MATTGEQRETESGIALAVLARPIRRSAFLLGKWLGLVAFGSGFVFLAGLAQGKLLTPKTVAEMNTLNGVSEEEEYGLGLQQRKDTCTGDYYFGHVGDVPGYGTVALTSTDGSRQVAMAVALPPAAP